MADLRKPKAVVSWSSGKDGALALQRVRARGEMDVVGLLTTIGENDRRVPIHFVPEALVEAQAARLSLPLHRAYLPPGCPNTEYEARLAVVLRKLAADGVTHVVFGDLLLEDIRRYREGWLAPLGLIPVFPLWGSDTGKLAREAIGGGYRAIVVSVDTRQAPGELAGRPYDGAFLADLPASADPCGENGEFHTFVHDGPGFRRPVDVKAGGRREEGNFSYVELA